MKRPATWPRHFAMTGRPLATSRPLHDLDQVRNFLSSAAPTAFIDLPWLPFYLALCFVFHPLIGFAAIAGAVVLIAITVTTDLLTRRSMKQRRLKHQPGAGWPTSTSATQKRFMFSAWVTG